MRELPHLPSSLSGSAIYSEYRGNFASALLEAENQLAQAVTQGTVDTIADAYLDVGIVCMLQGKVGAALENFACAAERTAPGHLRELRLHTYENVAVWVQYECFPGNIAGTSADIAARFDAMARVQKRVPIKEKLLEAPIPQDYRVEFERNEDIVRGSSISRSTRRSMRFMPDIDFETKYASLEAEVPNRITLAQLGAGGRILAHTTCIAAQLYREAGCALQAQTMLYQARESYDALSDHAGVGLTHMLEGDWLCAPFSCPEAGDFSLNSLELSLKTTLGQERTLQGLTAVNAPLQHDSALLAYHRAARSFRLAGAYRGIAAIELRHGFLASLRNDYQDAHHFAVKAREIFDETGDLLGVQLAQTHVLLAEVARNTKVDVARAGDIGHWSDIEGCFGYIVGLGSILGRAGRYWADMVGDSERALSCFRLEHALAVQLGAEAMAIRSALAQGEIHRAVGNHSAALIAYREGLDWHYRKANYPEQNSSSTENTSSSSSLSSEDMGTQLQAKLAEIAEQFDEDSEYFPVLEEFNRTMNSYKEQLDQRQAALIQQIGGPGNAAVRGVLIISALYSVCCNMDNHTEMNKLAATLREKLCLLQLPFLERKAVEQIAWQSEFYGLLGEARSLERTTQRGFDQIEELYQKALEIAQGPLASAGTSAEESIVLYRMGRKEEAKGAFRAYLKGVMEQRQNMVPVLDESAEVSHMINIFDRGTLSAAFAFFMGLRAYEEAEGCVSALQQRFGPDWWNTGDSPWGTLRQVAELHENRGRMENALKDYERAISDFEQRRDRLLRDEMRSALAGTLDAQALHFHAARAACRSASSASDDITARTALARAFTFSEKGRARALLDLMASTSLMNIAIRNKNEQAAIRRWIELEAKRTLWRGLMVMAQRQTSSERDAEHQTTNLKKQLDGLDTQMDKIEARLHIEAPAFLEVVTPKSRLLSLDSVVARLPENTALLQYAFLRNDFIAWAITREGMTEYVLKEHDSKAIARSIHTFRDACIRGDHPDGYNLALIFLAPFAKTLATHNRLIIVAYDEAHQLPFHALPLESGEPLCATHIVSYLPSASSLAFCGDGRLSDAPSILAIGNPTGDLPEAEREAHYVRSLFEHGFLLTGEQATEGRVRDALHSHNVLHFATHGRTYREAPLRSSLRLASEKKAGDSDDSWHDGDLTAYELFGFQLKSPLVVLSACGTALGMTTRGSEVVGLSRAWLGAGASAIVVSLWNVNDKSSSVLMRHFYDGLQQGDDAATAMQAAQNRLRTMTADEYAGACAEIDRRMEPVPRRQPTKQVADKHRKQEPRSRFLYPVEESPVKDHSSPRFWAPFIVIGGLTSVPTLSGELVRVDGGEPVGPGHGRAFSSRPTVE